jgi:tRNA pseudouridine13 synthase
MAGPMPPWYVTADLPGTGGRLRDRPEDFRVREVPLYEACGEGDHLYLRIEKRGMSTYEALRRVAEALGVPERAVGYAGLKDTRAVTEQTVSVEHMREGRVERALSEVPDLRLVSLARHRNKLRLGHTSGNRFEIVVRGVADDAAERATRILAALAGAGCPNWFGEQRFGVHGDNHLAGRTLVKGAADRSVRGRPKAVRRLLVSAYQSHLFNLLLEERGPDLTRLADGDLAWLHDRGAVFEVEDPEREQPRADRLEISPSGPLFGTRTTLAGGEPGRRERALLESEALRPEDFKVPGVGNARGARRPFRVPVTETAVEAVEDADEPALRLRFRLPPGSYATALLAEVLKD